MAELILEHIYKEFDKNVTAVSDFHLHIEDEEFIVFVGPSGCGKSTTLRMIAGLEEITSGSIYINGKRVNDVAPKYRDIAIVFQNYALYPHMTVYGNMAFGLKNRKFPKAEIHDRVMNAARIWGWRSYWTENRKRYPAARQRVALGRAIVRDAQVFLMDEPLSNLDAKLRVQMRAEIAMLHQRLKTTTIYVTHDQTEAMTMATRLVVMKDGFIQQIGSPKEVYEYPENVFVGGFIGSPAMNFFTGVVGEGSFTIGDTRLLIPERQMNMLRDFGYIGKEAIIGIRPEHIEEATAINGNGTKSNVSVLVEVSELTGAETMVYSSLEGQKFVARLSAETTTRPAQSVDLAFVMDKVHFFDKDTELRIRPVQKAAELVEMS